MDVHDIGSEGVAHAAGKDFAILSLCGFNLQRGNRSLVTHFIPPLIPMFRWVHDHRVLVTAPNHCHWIVTDGFAFQDDRIPDPDCVTLILGRESGRDCVPGISLRIVESGRNDAATTRCHAQQAGDNQGNK